jgi:uncharacterized protein (TIGR02266 family)
LVDSERPTLDSAPPFEHLEQGPPQDELAQTFAVLGEQRQIISALRQRVVALESQLTTALEALREKDQDRGSPPELLSAAPCESIPAHDGVPEPPASPAHTVSVPTEAATLRQISAALHPDTIPSPSRRKNPRVPCEVEVEFSQDSELYAGITADLSQGGLFIATYHPYPLGTRLDLGFELPDGTRVQACGEVRWLRDGVSGVSRPGMGVAFVEISADALASITEFCRQCAPLYIEL